MACTDFDLLSRWSSGDRGAGAELFERHYERVVRFFRNKASDGVQDDLVQQTFLRCVRAERAVRTATSFRAYLLRIAYTTLMDHLRDEARRRSRDHASFWEEAPGPALDDRSTDALGQSPENAMVRHEEARVLLKALRQLPLKYQVVLELRYWEDLTGEEISSVISAPLGTVKTRLRQGRKRLQDEIARVVTTPEAVRTTLDDLESWARRVGAAARRDELAPQ